MNKNNLKCGIQMHLDQKAISDKNITASFEYCDCILQNTTKSQHIQKDELSTF